MGVRRGILPAVYFFLLVVFMGGVLVGTVGAVGSSAVLFSNINQSVGASGALINDTSFVAHGFTTGNHSNGYDVARLILKMKASGTRTPAISLYTSGDGLPDERLCGFSELVANSSEQVSGLSADHALRPDTKYFLYVAGGNGTGSFELSLGAGGAVGLDSSSLPGWGVSGSKLVSGDGGGSWLFSEGFLPRYSVFGEPRSTPVTVNSPPVFLGDPVFSVLENVLGVGVVVFSDGDPGDNVTGYSVSGGVDAGLFEITDGGVLSFVSVPDFERPGDDNGNNFYLVEVTAVSGSGSRVLFSRQSLIVRVGDVDERPFVLGVPVLSFVSSTSLFVSWFEPGNTGPVVSGYEVEYRESGELTFSSWPHDDDSTSAALTNLSPGIDYEVRVRAVNDEGFGGWSPVVSVAAVGISEVVVSGVTRTGAVVNVTLDNHRGLSTRLYLRYGSVGSSGPWNNILVQDVSAGEAVFNLTGLSPDTSYYVQVSLGEDFPEGGRGSVVFATQKLPDGLFLISPSEGDYIRDGLVFNASYVGGDVKLVEFGYGKSGDGNFTWVTGARGVGSFWSALLDTRVLADGSYDVAVRNTGLNDTVYLSMDFHTVVVDNSVPVFSLISPVGGGVGGVVLFNVSAVDGSGVRSVEFGFRSSGSAQIAWFEGVEGPGGFWSVEMDTAGVSDGSYFVSVRVVDFVGNRNVSTDFLTLTVDNVPDGSVSGRGGSGRGSGGSSSGSGGGGGGSSSVSVCSAVSGAAGEVRQSRSWYGLGAGSVAEFVVSNPEIPVSLVRFNVSEPVTSVGMTVSASSGLPLNFSGVYDGILYGYFDLNVCGLAESVVYSRSIAFRVSRSFVSENGGFGSDVVLLRRENRGWVEVDLVFRGSDSVDYFYEAELEGFFAYAVVLRSSRDGSGVPEVSPVVEVGVVDENVSGESGDESVTGQSDRSGGSDAGVSAGSYRGSGGVGFSDVLFLGFLFVLTFVGVFWFLTKGVGCFSSGVSLNVLFIGSLFVLASLAVFWFLTRRPAWSGISLFDVLFLIGLFVLTFVGVFWFMARKERKRIFSFS